ncbi:nuclear transport factor 2 family protein [Mycobacterium sp. UM_CSW]|uniref:nuclear transport factor 2 family protein n=1 Tax=Mycobacterium sp. UM_CSW TaxID=1370119 RepID=UPI001377C911|nr:nuclear transport factor 2 family protein [Mycobacterium sp. UM_CSW]
MWASSAWKAALASLGIAMVLVCVVPDGNSTAAPDDEAATMQRQRAIVGAFATAIVHDDHAGIAEHATPDIVWTIPGSSMVSGRATGIDDVTRLADTFAQYGLHISPRGFAFGQDTVAVTLHDTGEHNGKRLEQDVVNVLTIRDDKISEVTAHLTDVGSFDAYFS